MPTVLGATQSRNIVSCKTATPVYRKDYFKQEDIMRIILVFACAALAGCVQTAHLSEALSGGGVERVEGRYRTETGSQSAWGRLRNGLRPWYWDGVFLRT